MYLFVAIIEGNHLVNSLLNRLSQQLYADSKRSCLINTLLRVIFLRIMSYASRLCLASGDNFFDCLTSGVPIDKIDQLNLAAIINHGIGAGNLLHAVITSFHENIG